MEFFAEVVKIDVKLERLGNALAVPFLYDLYLPYRKRFVDLRSDVIREFFVSYSTYPVVVLGTPIIRGIRTTADLDLSSKAFHIETLKRKGKSYGTDFPGSFVTWGNAHEFLTDSKISPELIQLLWYFAVLRAKPMGIPHDESRKYYNHIIPSPLSIFTVLDKDNQPLVISPFSAVMALNVGKSSPERIPYFSKTFHVRRAKVYTFVTDGRHVRFAGPFRAFVPDLEGINLEIEPGEAFLDHYIGLAVFPLRGNSIEYVKSIYRERHSPSYFLLLGCLPFSPELYYLLNFGSTGDAGKHRIVSEENFRLWVEEFNKTLTVLHKKLDFQEVWDRRVFFRLYGKWIEKYNSLFRTYEGHFILKAMAWGINPLEESLDEILKHPRDMLLEVPNPASLSKISNDADRVIENLLKMGLGMMI